MNREIKMFLFDIRESIESIENFLGDKWDFNVYKSDKMLRRAVERELEIIGEAMNRIGRNLTIDYKTVDFRSERLCPDDLVILRK